MKKRVLIFDTFKPYVDNESLVFCKPAGSKLFRLFTIPEIYNHSDIIDKLYDKGVLVNGVFAFKMSDEQLVDEVIKPLADDCGVESIMLGIEPSFYN